MGFFTVQPAFLLDVSLPAEQLMPQVRGVIRQMEWREVVDSAGACIDLRVPVAERRFWSPHLNVHASEVDGGSQLYCRFSPRPEIWTMFMAIYLVTACLIFTAGVWGYVQWFLGKSPWALWLIPLGMMLIFGLHAASLIGQSLSTDQMTQLRWRLKELMTRVAESNPAVDLRFPVEQQNP